MRVGGRGGGQPQPDDFLAELARWSAGDRAARAAAERSRTRALVDQSAATATWAGLLVDLAEASAEVTVAMGEVRLTGRLVGAGRDFAVLEGHRTRPVLVRIDAITALTPAAASGAATAPGGRRRPALELTLADVLDALAGEQAPVTVRSGAEAVSGSLVACGRDLITVRAEGPARRPVYVPISGLAYVELR